MLLFFISMILHRQISKHLQLLNWQRRTTRGMPMKNLHHPELFVGNAHYSNMTSFGKDFFDAGNMNICIFPTTAMTSIYRELKHLKTIFQDVFTELSVNLPLGFSFRRQVKKNEYPQYPICV
jgi:hypothetical protein